MLLANQHLPDGNQILAGIMSRIMSLFKIRPFQMALPKKCFKMFFFFFLLGCPASPVINSVFGRRCRKTASRGREDTTVWYRETMFSQMGSYDFLLPGLLHEYFLYLVSTHPGKTTRRCEPKEGYLHCSKRFDHRSH